MHPTLFVAAAASMASLATGTAMAADRYERRTIVVQAADLDLAGVPSQAELDRRIDKAVRRICGWDARCTDEAWQSTESQVDWAIDRDIRIHQLAAEREAQLRGGSVTYIPDEAPIAPPPQSGVQVVIYPGATVVYVPGR